MTGLRSAIGFLTILPVAPKDPGGLATARAWFPVVGLLLGAILGAIDLLMHSGYPFFTQDFPSFPPLLSAAILTVLLLALTRALHVDGFMDCCDALFGGFDRDRRLDILRDSHVGAFAVVGVVGLMLLKVAAIVALAPTARFWVILVFPCLSRWAMLLAMELFPYIRRSGLGTPFLQRRGWLQLAVGLVATVIIVVALTGPTGLALLAAATAVGWVVGAWASKLLGGVTGDVYGAVNEVAEVSVLVLAALLAYGFSDGFLSPLHEMVW